MKQTSIEWFATKDTDLTIQFTEGKLNQIQFAIEKIKCLEQAKQMHKQEISNALDVGYQIAEKEIPTWDDVRKAIELSKYNLPTLTITQIIEQLKQSKL